MDVWRVALLSLTIIMEARNQPELGQRMVAQVVMNRGGQEGVEAVLFQPGQFACWNGDSYVEGHLLRLAVLECWSVGAFPDDPWCVERWVEGHVGWRRRLRIGEADEWKRVWGLVTEVYEGSWTPPEEMGAMKHYDNPLFWPRGLPAWLRGCVEVGDHVFCE